MVAVKKRLLLSIFTFLHSSPLFLVCLPYSVVPSFLPSSPGSALISLIASSAHCLSGMHPLLANSSSNTALLRKPLLIYVCP